MRDEQFTDGSFLKKVTEGNREAIQKFCADLAKRLKSDGIHDVDAAIVLSGILEKISQGVSPDAAFGWKQISKGRRRENNELRDYLIKIAVSERMRSGQSHPDACRAVSSAAEDGGEFYLGFKMIEDICKGITKETEIPFPDDAFPVGNLKVHRPTKIK